ncbi:hypothetical protein MTO96_015543 [Rhipicephalus appendiculatus]
MNEVRILWLLAAVLVSSVWVDANNECVVVTPNVLRLGAQETVVVMVSGSPQRVNMTLESHPAGRRPFFQKTFYAVPGSPLTAQVSVGSDNLTELQLSKEDMQVTLTVQCGSLWTRQVRLGVSGIFGRSPLPADRQAHLPAGDHCPHQSGIPKTWCWNKETFILTKSSCSAHHFDVPKHTVLGEWKLVMRYGHKFLQNTTATFAVDKYVLPRFSVALKTVDYILPDFDQITVKARAKFVNKQIVRGFVTFRFSVKNEVGAEEEIGTSERPKALDAGDAEYKLRRDELVAKLGRPKVDALFAARARLVVEATVIEEATGIRESARSEQAVFSTSPYLVSTARSEKSFKPGFKFYVMADVTYANGEPATGVLTKLTCDGCDMQSNTATTDKNGVVTFFVASKIGDDRFNFKVETADPKYTNQQQARSNLLVSRYNDNSQKYLIIERKDPKTLLKVGESFEAVLFKSDGVQLTSAYYLVLSRGRVLKAGKVAVDNVIDHRVTFAVTPEMTPSFRVVVVGFLNGQLATDAVYVNAEPTCTQDSDFTLTRRNLDEQPGPGSTETLVLTGTAGTRVGLLGVDQAVYLLRRKDLLTREKVFQSMQAKDLGHGFDAGTAAVHTLANSGVAVLAVHGTYGGAGDGQRRSKREVTANILEQFQNETLRNCCSSGLLKDPFLRSCKDREEALHSYLVAGSALYSEKCVEAFATCCRHIENNQIVGRTNADDSDVLGDGDFNFEGGERRAFMETWLFKELEISENQETTYDVSLPDSITTWELSAVSVAPSGGICVLDPLEIRAFKKLFVEVNLPYSVIQNEQVEIPVTVYNYDRSDQMVRVAMLGTEHVCSGAKEGKPSAVRKIKVPRGQGRTVTFPVVPLAAGEREIHVAATSESSARDAVKVKLRVETPGVPKEDSFNIILDPQNTQKRKERHDASPKRRYRETFALGDGHLIEIPRPNISPQGRRAGVRTLRNRHRRQRDGRCAGGISQEPRYIASDAIGRILTFRKPDGSFAVWTSYASSLWLTAFVVRSLCEARKSVHIDDNVLTKGLSYILTQQQQDGSFHDIYKLIHGDLLGGVTGPLPLTAYTLLTLQECTKDGVEIPGLKKSTAKATVFIGKELERDKPAYETSLAAYALSLGDSPAKNDALVKLRSILQPGQDGGLHVSAGSEPLSIQATAYALMALLEAGGSRDDVTPLVQWLNLRMNPSGSLRSSQDTVVALQALSKYAIYARNSGIDLTCEVTRSNDRNFVRTVRIKRDNAQVRNRIEIPEFNDKVFVSVKGSGTATMYFVTSYHAPRYWCRLIVRGAFLEMFLTFISPGLQFKLDIDFWQKKVDINQVLKNNKKPRETYGMKVCARSLKDNVKGMAILDVGLMTGFKPITADLDKLVQSRIVDKYEYSQRSVVFYLQTIPADRDVCVEFGLDQEFAIGKLQSSSVKAYAYYDPDISCTKFYAPNSTSPLLKIKCDGPGQSDVCTCLEGGCPPENLQDMFTKSNGEILTTPECREEMRLHACDGVDFVWLGTARNTTHKDGFISARFLIETVLKPGIESNDELKDEQRVVKARDHCESFSIKDGAKYIIMGMDPKYKEKDDFGEEHYVYVIDSDSIVIDHSPKGRGTRRPRIRKPGQRGPNVAESPKNDNCDWEKLVAWFIKEFSNEDTRCYT